MSELRTPDANEAGEQRLHALIRRYREAEAALHAILNGQVDAVLDPVTAIPIMLQEAQNHLRASEARYRRLLTRSVMVVFELEADGTTVFVNEAVSELLGYTVDELLGRNWWEVLLTAKQRLLLEPLYNQLRDGDVVQYELPLTHKQGAVVITELNTVNRRKADGALNRILGMLVDITERRRAEEELAVYHVNQEFLARMHMADLTKANLMLRNLADMRQRMLEIEQAALADSENANRMKLQFLSTVSHELRTPLTSIKGFAMTLMATDVDWDTETQQSFIAIINEEADKLAHLVDQLLDSSQLQAGTFHVHLQPCSLSEIMRTAMAQLESVAANHRLVLDIPSDLPPIMADEQRIAAVIVNLVANAAKFSPKGTGISLSAVALDDNIQVDVHDEGPGIAVENRTNVFKAFWQPEQARDLHIKGVGLGLAICQGTVNAHGGSIWVADSESGTTISFTLPLQPSGSDPAHV